MRPEEQIMWQGRDWQIIKHFLLDQKEKKLGLLIAAPDHDSSNRYRGALSMISTLLSLESAAEQAAKRGL